MRDRRSRIVGIPRCVLRLDPLGLCHSHATQFLKAGIHPKIARERLGHSTIEVTLDLYSYVTETMQDDAARRIDIAL